MTELNWTVNFQIGWTWTVNFYWTELNFLNWTARMCELLLWTGVGLNCELLVEKHVKVIFCGEENVKNDFGDFLRDFTRTAGSKHKISKMNFDMWNLELTRRNVELISLELKLCLGQFTVQFSSVQFSVHLNCSKVQQFRTTKAHIWQHPIILIFLAQVSELYLAGL